jgi:hypothetical protein
MTLIIYALTPVRLPGMARGFSRCAAKGSGAGKVPVTLATSVCIAYLPLRPRPRLALGAW